MPFGGNTKAVSTAFPAGERLQKNGDAHHAHVTCHCIYRYGYKNTQQNPTPRNLCLK